MSGQGATRAALDAAAGIAVGARIGMVEGVLAALADGRLTREQADARIAWVYRTGSPMVAEVPPAVLRDAA